MVLNHLLMLSQKIVVCMLWSHVALVEVEVEASVIDLQCHDFPYLSTATSISLLFTYTCCWHEHSIASFMPAVRLHRLHCLVVTAYIMTLITLPRCYHISHYLTTQTCLSVYKTPFLGRRALSSFSCIFRLNIVALHDLPAWVLLKSYWT